MKTEQEIKEKINIYKKIKDKAFIFTSEFSLASGAIAALEWVFAKNATTGEGSGIKGKGGIKWRRLWK